MRVRNLRAADGRAGAVRFSEAPEPFPCILIFPPPLECAIAVGETVPSVQAGVGFEAFPGENWSHNFKATAAVGLRF